MEAEVFTGVGCWLNYDQLEENMSMPELIVTLTSLRERDHDDKKFAAALKGVDIDGEQEDPLEQARRRNAAKAAGGQVDPSDITNNRGILNVNNGIGYQTI